MEIRVYTPPEADSPAYVCVGRITAAVSATVVERHFTAGYFELTVPSAARHADKLAEGRLVWIDGGAWGIVDRIRREDGGSGDFVTASGRELKGLFLKSLRTKIAALLVKDGLAAFKDRLNPDTIGGTPFLGLTRPVIKAHGSSGALAIENAIAQAVAAAEGNISAEIEANIERMKVER